MLLALLLAQAQMETVTVGCADPNDQIMAGQMELEDGVACRRPRTITRERAASGGPLSAARQQSIRRTMDALLVDGPGSRWLWVPQSGRGDLYCGWTNARNRMGGYTGWQMFVVIFEGNRSTVVSSAALLDPEEDNEDSLRLCRIYGYEVSSPPL